MKRIFVCFCLFSAVFAYFCPAEAAVRVRAYTCLTGGTTGCLDKTSVSSLNNTDLSIVYDLSGGKVYMYEFNSTGTAAESSPTVIRPDDYSSAGNHELQQIYVGAGEIDTAELADAGVTVAKLAATLDLSDKTLTLGNPLYDLTPSSDDTWTGPKASVICGETIDQWEIIYIKYDTDGPRAFAYNANSTDGDNDTYPPVGIALETETAGDALDIGIVKGVARNDGWTLTHATDEGKPVYCSESADGGWELTPPADSGDHVIRIGTIVEVDNSDNGDVILFNFGFADVTVP